MGLNVRVTGPNKVRDLQTPAYVYTHQKHVDKIINAHLDVLHWLALSGIPLYAPAALALWKYLQEVNTVDVNPDETNRDILERLFALMYARVVAPNWPSPTHMPRQSGGQGPRRSLNRGGAPHTHVASKNR